MSILRPATPGFLVTLIATILLVVVSFSVPYFKSVYFLRASLTVENINGSITFGTLGYCFHLSNGTTCSKPSIGYQLDINALVGNDLPIEIPTVVVKWITYALFLHVVALILAAGSALFGLLAHVREFSMTCCSTFISGFAAIVAMVAFIFDIALFFIAKARINAVEGGAATIGSGVWLTLAAWLLLFFAGCFYGFGRCCISRRPRDLERRRDKPNVEDRYAESMRLDAVKAEADRKARQKQGEIGLPAFQEYEQTQPLTKHDPEDYVEDGDHIVPLSSLRNASNAGPATYTRQGTSRQGSQTAGGYAQAPAGTRAVDDYYDGSNQTNAYPPRRQMSAHTMDSSTVSSYSYPPPVASPPIPTLPPAPTGPSAGSQFLAVGTQPGHSQFPSAASQNVGHLAGGTSYHSAALHQQYASNYSQYPDPYAAPQPEHTFNPELYNNTGLMNPPVASPTGGYHPSDPSPYFTQPNYHHSPSPPPQQPDRSYTLGGDSYGASAIPDYQNPSGYDASYYAHYAPPTSTPSPAPINTHVSPPPEPVATSPRGPRAPQNPVYDDSPPVYDVATAQPPGQWGAKR